MTMNLRPDFCGASSSHAGVGLTIAILSGLRACSEYPDVLIALARLLSSEIIFVICLRDADGTGQARAWRRCADRAR